MCTVRTTTREIFVEGIKELIKTDYAWRGEPPLSDKELQRRAEERYEELYGKK